MNAPKDLIPDELVQVAMTAYEHDGPCPCSHGGMRAALVAYESAKWQPIETAPRDRRILAVVDGGVRFVKYGKTSHVPLYGFCLADQGAEEFDICQPTHWMPLPGPLQ